MEEIQVISISKVTRAESMENHSFSRIELSPWDVQFLLVKRIQRGLLFHKPIHHQAPEHFGNNTLIDHLKISLSRTLDFFPPLSGRLSKKENDDNTTSFFIDCNNEGAQFTHAIIHGLKVGDILEPDYVPPIVHSFFPINRGYNHQGNSQPLLAVQVTELEDGVFIACSMSHSVADGTSFWHFFNSWSEVSRGFSSISKSPVFTRFLPDDTTYSIHIPKIGDEQIGDIFIREPVQERFFHFSKENISKLKAKANSEMSTKNISSLQAVLAHIWRSVTRCRSLDADLEFTIKLPVGARGRFRPPLPDGYFGNAIQVAFPKNITAGQLLENGLGWAAWEINKIVGENTNETMRRYYEECITNPKIVDPSVFRVDHSLLISSSPKFNVYGTDFGWGKPLAVRSGIGYQYDGTITLFPGAEEGTIDIDVFLSHETFLAMETDQEFMGVITI